jgi:hypothetical protein
MEHGTQYEMARLAADTFNLWTVERLERLSDADRRAVLALASELTRRTGVPFRSGDGFRKKKRPGS